MESFRKLGVNEALIKALKEHNFTEPSEIQEKTIPLVLAGKDILGGAQTGSGKTLAFGTGLLQNCEKGKGIQALILTPTRELAEQIKKALHQFARYNPLSIVSIYGGVSIQPQIHDLRRADIVVGTPGRILDHLQRNTLNLKEVKTLILDEADRMLDMGFIDDVRKIISQCPKKRQTLLFSATLSREITRLSTDYMHNPVEILAGQQVDPTKLKQTYYEVANQGKFSLLVHFLKHEKAGLVMVFCNTRHGVDFVSRNLNSAGIEAEPIHGGLSQNKRTKTLESFHSGKTYVLVCSDVAARGLDIKGVSHIYNYDIPPNSKDYIHRIGRTARAGKEGEAISLLTERDYENMRSVLNDSQIHIKRMEVPANIEIIAQRKHYADRGGRGRDQGRSSGSRYSGRSRGYQSVRSGGQSRGGYQGRSSGRGYGGGRNYSRDRPSSERSYHSAGSSSSGHSGYVKNADGTYAKARPSSGHYGARSEGYGDRSRGSNYHRESKGRSFGGDHRGREHRSHEGGRERSSSGGHGRSGGRSGERSGYSRPRRRF
ncbi:MAG: DEAD/DEAH box helicase [Nanoarchaeota archaeon]|nr:DEAD/DEAH box helicase [Nanoarchaeota archaeon]